MNLTESNIEHASLEWFGELACAHVDLAFPVIFPAVRGVLPQKLRSRKIGDASFGQEVSG